MTSTTPKAQAVFQPLVSHPDDDQAVDMAGALKTLNVANATLYELIGNGDLVTYQVGRRRFTTKRCLRELQARLIQKTAQSHAFGLKPIADAAKRPRGRPRKNDQSATAMQGRTP